MGPGNLGHRHHLNGVHRFRLHPVHTPRAGMSRRFLARAVPHRTIRAMITDMRRPATRIPVQKETRPTVVMHRFRRTRRRHGDFQYAHKFIFENNFVAVRRGLHGVIAVGESRSVLPVQVKIPRNREYRTHCQNDDDSQPSRAEAAACWFHATNYKDFRVADEGRCLNSHTPPTARVNRPVLAASSLVPTARAIQAYILSVAAAAGNPTPHKAPEAVPRSSFLFERVYARAVFEVKRESNLARAA